MPELHPRTPIDRLTLAALRAVRGAVLLVAAGAARAQSSQPPAPPVPAAARAAMGRARVADSLGRADDARAHYEAALAAHPAYVDASIALATLLIENANAAEAREVIARAVKRSPGDPRLVNLRIRRRSAAAADSSASGGVTSDRKQRAANPNAEGVGLALAQVLATRGDHAGAAALYDTLLVAPAPSERVATAAVRHAIAVGDIVRAATLLRAARSRHPDSTTLIALADSLPNRPRPGQDAPPRPPECRTCACFTLRRVCKARCGVGAGV